MDKDLKEIFQRSLPEIPEPRLMTIAEIMADPEKHYRELISLFKSGNHKIHANQSREELTVMADSYTPSGHDIDEELAKSARRVLDFKSELKPNEDIVITVSSYGEKLFKTIVTKLAILDFYRTYPIRPWYKFINHWGHFSKNQNTLCLSNYAITESSSRIEHITGVEMDTIEIPNEKPTKQWKFYGFYDDGEQLDQTFGHDQNRYCVFIEALKTAFIAASHGTAYNELNDCVRGVY